MRKTVITIILMMFITLFSSPHADAQTYIGIDRMSGTEEDTSLTMKPESPAERTTVTIKVENYNTDIRRTDISWFRDGKLISRGIGKTTIDIIAPESGDSTIIDVLLITVEGSSYRKSITVRPGTIHLIWEAQTYTPPLIKSKTLPSSDAIIRIVALPDMGSKTPEAKTLVYEWEHNGETLPANSGYGKNVLEIKGPNIFGRAYISVRASTIAGQVIGSGSTYIFPFEPIINIYEQDPLAGINYNLALGKNHQLTKSETVLVAEPYYFNQEDVSKDKIQYTWIINGEEVTPEPSSLNMLTLRQEGGQGSADVTVGARSLINTLSRAVVKIKVSFGYTLF